MKRIALAATVALALGCAFAPQIAVTQSQSKATPLPTACTAAAFKAFSKAVWRLGVWERGKPPAKVIAALRRRLGCAPGHHRVAMKERWRADKAAYFEHRARKLATMRWEPYICGDRRYALPCDVTECESGFYFGHTSGAYGLLQSTWEYWGGLRFAPYPGGATPRQQAIIARTVWEAVGPGGWECPL